MVTNYKKRRFDFLTIPGGSGDTKDLGYTFVLDDGLSVAEVKNQFLRYSDWIDSVKFGWGTGYIADDIERKIALYQDYSIDIFFGGTLFELAVLQNSVDEYLETLKTLNVSNVEVSAGSVAIPHEQKCSYIEHMSDTFDVLSEVGPKDTDTTLSHEVWRRRCQNELNAGASYVILEGRASGNAGIYNEGGKVKDVIVNAVTNEVPLKHLIFEAPRKKQQVWFINRFGADVNLGNIFMSDVLKLQTLRLGLRADTLQAIHGQTDQD